MRIHNNTSSDLIFDDLKFPNAGIGQSILLAGQTIDVYNEDAQKSNHLNNLLVSGAVLKLGDQEPSDSQLNADPLVALFAAVDDLAARVTALEGGS